MTRAPTFLLALASTACLPKLGSGDSRPPEGDADTDVDADADTDVGSVLLDEDAELPYSPENNTYVDFFFDARAGAWVHLELASETAEGLIGVLITPGKACWLEVPTWGWYKEEHANEGWIRVTDGGRYCLSVFGSAAEGGSLVHATATVVGEDGLPWGDDSEPCVAGQDACECTETCNCDEIHG